MPSVEGFCGIKRLRRLGKEEDSDFLFSYERYEMMGGVGETWLFPALLKKRVSSLKQLQSVPWVVTMLKRERERGEKRRRVSRNLARLWSGRYRYRYLLVTETRETMNAVNSYPYHTFPRSVRFAFVFHHPHVAKRPHMVVLSHLAERISLTNHS